MPALDRARIVETMNSMVWYHRIELAPGIVTPGADWEALLAQPVDAVRAQFAVKPAAYYHTIRAAVARGSAAASRQPVQAVPG